MSVTHFTYGIAWWFFPVARILRWLGFSSHEAANVLQYGVHVRIQK